MAKSKTRVVRLYNASKQLLALQIRPPGADFYTNESQVRLRPGQDALLPYRHLREDQVANLCSRGMLRIIYDSDVADENNAAMNPD
jgi:hypothetical protein